MSQFSRTGISNLIRHTSGTYYLQTKIKGKKVRRSLKTKSKDLARHVLGARMQELRAEAEKVSAIRGHVPATILEYLVDWKNYQLARTDIEETTKSNYIEISKWIERRFPNDSPPNEMRADLWAEIVEEYAPSPANNILSMLRTIAASMVRNGALRENPFASLKPCKPRRAEVNALSLDQVLAVINSIREQKRSYSDEAADFVTVLAFSGLRIGQVRGLTAEDVGAKVLRVRSGVSGSKGADTRLLPLNRFLEPVLRRRVAAGCDPLFEMQSPREALKNAITRLGLPKQRIHDLRHFFATYCNEQGVDIPTVSRWLGHKDGGILAMKTYGHLRDDHSHAMAKLI